MDHDVAMLHQLAQNLAAARRGLLQRDRLLVAVEGREIKALPAAGERAALAVGLAARPLDPNHFGAHVGQHLAAEWRRDVAAEIKYPDAVENFFQWPSCRLSLRPRKLNSIVITIDSAVKACAYDRSELC